MPRVKITDSYFYKFTQKYGKPLTEYSSFQKATETLNQKTINAYRSELSKFFLWLGEDPDTVIANRKLHIKADDDTLDHYERKVKIYKKYLEDNGNAGYGISSSIGRIAGFFTNNGKKYSLQIDKMKYREITVRKKYAPSNNEVQKLYSYCESPRDRLIVLLAYHAGLAPIDIAGVTVDQIPTEPFQYYQGTRSKTCIVWHAVSTPEIASEYQAYLTIRNHIIEKKELTTKKLFITREGTISDGESIGQTLEKLIIKSGFGKVNGFTPKSLRMAFNMELRRAKIDSELKEAFMGHTTGIKFHYEAQQQLEEDLVEAMQSAYNSLSLAAQAVVDKSAKVEVEELRRLVAEQNQKIAKLEELGLAFAEHLGRDMEADGSATWLKKKPE